MSQTTLPAADRAAPPGNVPQATPPTRRPVPGQAAVATVLARADVLVDGPRSWDMRVHDPGVFPRLLRNGSLALGETYMDGAWDCEALDQISRACCVRGWMKPSSAGPTAGTPCVRGCSTASGAGAPSRSASATTTWATISTAPCSGRA